MKKIFITAVFSILILVGFSSCTYLQLGKVYVQNLSGSKIKNVEIYWTSLEGEEQSIEIDEIRSGSVSDYYGVLITDAGRANIDGEYKVPFFISYEIEDEVFGVSSSKTSKVDKEGNYYDMKAVFVADQSYCIKIYKDFYLIEEE